MDYSHLSDFEINELVAKATRVSHETYPDFSPEPYVWNEELKSEFNPCNNPADAWPIIVDNKIKIEPMRRVRNYNEWYEEWDASVNSPHFCESHKNPLRAAMIVFLLSQDVNHA